MGNMGTGVNAVTIQMKELRNKNSLYSASLMESVEIQAPNIPFSDFVLLPTKSIRGADLISLFSFSIINVINVL